MTDREIMQQALEDIPLGYTRDANGNVLTLKNSDGYWFKCTRDAHGNVLTFKSSDGYWFKYTRDKQGRVLTLKKGNSND